MKIDTMINTNNIWINVPCPCCDYENEITVRDIELETVVYCSNCKSSVNLIDEGASVYCGVKAIKTTLKSLQRAFKRK